MFKKSYLVIFLQPYEWLSGTWVSVGKYCNDVKFEEIETEQGRRLVFRVRFTNLDLMRELAGNPHIKYSYFGRFSRELWKSYNP